jgi:hypothetical protein
VAFSTVAKAGDPGVVGRYFQYRLTFTSADPRYTATLSSIAAAYVSPPPAPGNFSGTALSVSSLRWTWQDNSADQYQEDGFAVYDAEVKAVCNVGVGPVPGGVAEQGRGITAHNGIPAAVQGDADHLAHLGAGDDPGGIKVAAVVFAVDDVQGNHGVDGVGVDDFILVGEIGGARGHDHESKHHGAGQDQAKRSLQVLHLLSSF